MSNYVEVKNSIEDVNVISSKFLTSPHCIEQVFFEVRI